LHGGADSTYVAIICENRCDKRELVIEMAVINRHIGQLRRDLEPSLVDRVQDQYPVQVEGDEMIPGSLLARFDASIIVLATILGLSASTLAQENAPANPCEAAEEFKEFDFWVGEWEVRTADGKLAGRNSIKSTQKGCVLLENWTGVSGGKGMSINYLDKTTDEWVQIWNSEGGSQINIRGGLTADGMRLAGNIHYVANGKTALFRGLWTQLDDGRVRQFFEQSNDEGKTWVPWFEGFYTRRN